MSELIVEAVETVKELLKGHNTLCVCELPDGPCNLVALHVLKLLGYLFEDLVPLFLRECFPIPA